MTAPWLTVVGLGEDGLDGLSPRALEAIKEGYFLVGGARNLEKIPQSVSSAERISWRGTEETLAAILARRGEAVVVLASGDPMWWGLGATLAKAIDPAEMRVLPAPGAFSLASARLGWPLAEVETLTVHGRPLEGLIRVLSDGARLLVLCRDAATPGEAARLLTEQGFGPSRLWALEHLGGDRERVLAGTAADWSHPPGADLVTLAIDCAAETGRHPLPGCGGLPDDAFVHDGMLTKRAVRAATLSALRPFPGGHLWDLGAGCGSVAVEWARAHPRCTALAVERKAERLDMIEANRLALGVPWLEVLAGTVPQSLAGRADRPDAVFVGGAVSAPGVLEAGWDALKDGGRIVANAVTIEAEARLFEMHRLHGGDVTRIAVSEVAETPGGLNAWKALAPVTQWSCWK